MNHILVNDEGDTVNLRKYPDHILVIRKYDTRDGKKAKAHIAKTGNMNIMLRIYKEKGYSKLVSY